jgi:uncharacterized protein
MSMFNFVTYQDQINKACSQYYIKSLVAFGSALKDDFNDDSDIDLVVEIDSTEKDLDHFSVYFDFKESLSKVFNRKIDLISKNSLNNPILKKNIERNSLLVYER